MDTRIPEDYIKPSRKKEINLIALFLLAIASIINLVSLLIRIPYMSAENQIQDPPLQPGSAGRANRFRGLSRKFHCGRLKATLSNETTSDHLKKASRNSKLVVQIVTLADGRKVARRNDGKLFIKKKHPRDFKKIVSPAPFDAGTEHIFRVK